MKKLGLLFLMTFLMSACAKPNYAQAENETPKPKTKDEVQCPYLLSVEPICFDLSWQTNPQDSQGAVFDLKFWSKTTGTPQGPLIDPPQTLAVVLWMPDMGHGSSPVEIQRQATGNFRVSRIYFIMAGDWEIRVQLKDATNVLDQVIIPIHIQQ